MKKKILRLLTIVLSLMFVLAGCQGASKNTSSTNNETATKEQTKTIKIGSIRALGTITPYISEEEGIFKEQDINVEIVDFSDGSALMEAFASGGIDIGICGIAPIATWQSKGVELKVVASANGGGHVIITRKDSGINSIADLAGHKLAEPNLGTVTDTLLRDHILPSGNINEKNLQIVSGLKPADMASSLAATHEVDAALTWEPFASQAESKYDDIKVLYDAAKEIQTETGSKSLYPVNVVVASQNFIDNNPELLKSFLKSYVKTVDFINNDSTANDKLAKVLELDKDILIKARKRVDYTYKVDVDASLKTLQWAHDLGYLETIPKKDELFDLRFLPE